MDPMRAANKNLVQIAKEINILKERINELLNRELDSEKQQRYIRMVMNNMRICERTLAAHRVILKQKIKKTN